MKTDKDSEQTPCRCACACGKKRERSAKARAIKYVLWILFILLLIAGARFANLSGS